MLSSLLIAMSATLVPPGHAVVDHSQPYHYTQPTIRKFESWPEDHCRRESYIKYCRRLDELWMEYRANNSTPEAFRTYCREAALAKRHYVYSDPWLAPVHQNERDMYWMRQAPATSWEHDHLDILRHDTGGE